MLKTEAKSSKSRILNVRVSEEEHAAIKSAAHEAGRTTSAFFKSLILEGAGVQAAFNDDDRHMISLMLEDMRRIGINLNQVARSLNSGKHVHPEEIRIQIKNVAMMQSMVQRELRRAAIRAGQKRRGENP